MPSASFGTRSKETTTIITTVEIKRVIQGQIWGGGMDVRLSEAIFSVSYDLNLQRKGLRLLNFHSREKEYLEISVLTMFPNQEKYD